MTDEKEYRLHSLKWSATAVAYCDYTALEALKDFLRLRTAGRKLVIERHPKHGWRVREPDALERRDLRPRLDECGLWRDRQVQARGHRR